MVSRSQWRGLIEGNLPTGYWLSRNHGHSTPPCKAKHSLTRHAMRARMPLPSHDRPHLWASAPWPQSREGRGPSFGASSCWCPRATTLWIHMRPSSQSLPQPQKMPTHPSNQPDAPQGHTPQTKESCSGQLGGVCATRKAARLALEATATPCPLFTRNGLPSKWDPTLVMA